MNGYNATKPTRARVAGLSAAVALGWLGAAAALRAEDRNVPQALEPLIAREVAGALAEHKNACCVVGLVRGNNRVVVGRGEFSPNRRPDGETVFEIGSVTKVFTGLLLADAIQRGRMRLSDPITRYLPADKRIATFEGRAITVEDLVTHTSGWPRMPDNFRPRDPLNPYADYSEQQMFEFLASYRLPRAPGAEFEYSNLGYGLLGCALTRNAGTSYESLVAERIARPLGMTDTVIRLSAQQRARLAAPHDEHGKQVGNWDIPTLAGAGALRSTVNDLLRFVRANLEPGKSPLAAAIELSQQPRRDAGRGQRIALGWHVDTGERLLWHNGQTGGYHSYLAIDPEQKLGVVVLCNTATHAVDTIGLNLLRALRQRQP